MNDSLQAVHEAQQQKQRTAFQELEAECRSAQAERDALDNYQILPNLTPNSA
jgi:hypothetical protein